MGYYKLSQHFCWKFNLQLSINEIRCTLFVVVVVVVLTRRDGEC